MRRIFTFTLFFKEFFFLPFCNRWKLYNVPFIVCCCNEIFAKNEIVAEKWKYRLCIKNILRTFFLLEALLGVFMKRPKGRFVSDQVLSKHRSNIIFCLHILNFLSCSFLSDKMVIFERDIFWYCIRKEENRTNLVCVEDPNHFAGFLLGADTEL